MYLNDLSHGLLKIVFNNCSFREVSHHLILTSFDLYVNKSILLSLNGMKKDLIYIAILLSHSESG